MIRLGAQHAAKACAMLKGRQTFKPDLRKTILEATCKQSVQLRALTRPYQTGPIRANAPSALPLANPGKQKASRVVRVVQGIAVVSVAYIGLNLERAPFTERLRLLAIPVRKSLR